MQKRNYKTVEFPRSRIATFDIGAITLKPMAIGEMVGIGQILHLTVPVDHNAVDGVTAPAAAPESPGHVPGAECLEYADVGNGRQAALD